MGIYDHTINKSDEGDFSIPFKNIPDRVYFVVDVTILAELAMNFY
jgi:hypothetical protein